jgi:hypothetical protein
MDESLRATLVKTINVASVTAYTAGGNETLGAPVALAAHVENTDEVITAENGTQLSPSHLLILDTAIGLDARVWMPGEVPASTPGKKPMAVRAFYDPDTGVTDHWEVLL